MSDPSSDSADDAPEASAGESLRPRRNPNLEAGLYVVATPIGNLRDVTLRALDVLASADLVAAEDTRVSAKLLHAYGIKARMRAYHDHSDAGVRDEILAVLAGGGRVALISDAGTPLVSDPGFKLVRAAIEAGHRVAPVPGASAALAALAAAGLPTDRFLFAGFPPAKAQARAHVFEELADVRGSLVFYETGPRLAESLGAMSAAFGAREAAVARELTKLYEDVRRGTLDALAAAYAREAAPKGEIVVIVGPPPARAAASDAEVDSALRLELSRASMRDAATSVAMQFGLSRRDVYARALVLKESSAGEADA